MGGEVPRNPTNLDLAWAPGGGVQGMLVEGMDESTPGRGPRSVCNGRSLHLEQLNYGDRSHNGIV